MNETERRAAARKAYEDALKAVLKAYLAAEKAYNDALHAIEEEP